MSSASPLIAPPTSSARNVTSSYPSISSDEPIGIVFGSTATTPQRVRVPEYVLDPIGTPPMPSVYAVTFATNVRCPPSVLIILTAPLGVRYRPIAQPVLEVLTLTWYQSSSPSVTGPAAIWIVTPSFTVVTMPWAMPGPARTFRPRPSVPVTTAD